MCCYVTVKIIRFDTMNVRTCFTETDSLALTDKTNCEVSEEHALNSILDSKSDSLRA